MSKLDLFDRPDEQTFHCMLSDTQLLCYLLGCHVVFHYFLRLFSQHALCQRILHTLTAHWVVLSQPMSLLPKARKRVRNQPALWVCNKRQVTIDLDREDDFLDHTAAHSLGNWGGGIPHTRSLCTS